MFRGLLVFLLLALPTLAEKIDPTAQTRLRVGLTYRDESIDPGGIGIVDLSVTNDGEPVTGVVMRGSIEGGEILSATPLEWLSGAPTSTCTIVGGVAECRIAAMTAANHFELVRLTYRAPDRREGGKVAGLASVTADRPNSEPGFDTERSELPLRRMFTVTSAADSGPGTLRQAILESAPACEKTPCTIAFEGVNLIHPASALPELRGIMRVNGRESRVTIDGAQLAAGDGLLFAGGCGFEVWNMEVRNFPGHAIEARQTSQDRNGCPYAYIGVFVERSELAGNERGVVAKGIDAALKWNFIHDQRRAGIFIDGSYYSEIYNNVVVNNGATGIYLNTANESQNGGIPPGADVIENVVHGNGEWGIVRTRNNGMVRMIRNSTARNGLYGVDVGLDLATPDRPNAVIPNKPVILSATYDAATNTTVIRANAEYGIHVYASTSLSRYGYPEAEIYLGELWGFPTRTNELRVAADLRGMWITATRTTSQTLYFAIDEGAAPTTNVWRPPTGYNTSELSDPVRVE